MEAGSFIMVGEYASMFHVCMYGVAYASMFHVCMYGVAYASR